MDFDANEIEQRLAVKLTMTALQGDGSITAAREAVAILDRIRSRQAADEHRRRMEELAGLPVDLARYLGYLGESAMSVEGDELGRAMSAEEREAFHAGQRQRLRELRAVELDQAVRGRKNPSPWMRQGK